MKTDKKNLDAAELAVNEQFQVTIKQAREAVRRELSDALQQREKLNETIADLRSSFASLNRLSDDADDIEMPPILKDLATVNFHDLGLTDAIGEALKAYPGLNAVGIKGRLQSWGYPVDDYSNVLASIHAVLKRLEARGKVTSQIEDGKAVYTWKTD